MSSYYFSLYTAGVAALIQSAYTHTQLGGLLIVSLCWIIRAFCLSSEVIHWLSPASKLLHVGSEICTFMFLWMYSCRKWGVALQHMEHIFIQISIIQECLLSFLRVLEETSNWYTMTVKTKWQKEKKISLNIQPSPLEPEATFRHPPLPQFRSHFFFLNLNVVFSLICILNACLYIM